MVVQFPRIASAAAAMFWLSEEEKRLGQLDDITAGYAMPGKVVERVKRTT